MYVLATITYKIAKNAFIKYLVRTYGVVLESSRTIILVTALMKEDERGGEGHTSENLLHQSAT
jgi:hypothetical protein